MGAPASAKSKAPLKLGAVLWDRISSWLDQGEKALCVFNLKISRRRKMITGPQSVAEAPGTAACQSAFPFPKLCPQVSRASDYVLSSWCPVPPDPPLWQHLVGVRQASNGWFQMPSSVGAKVGSRGEGTAFRPLPSLGRELYRGQEWFHHRPGPLPGCVLFPAHPHPPPGFIFPAKSPDRTWLGASLSEAATPRQACR